MKLPWKVRSSLWVQFHQFVWVRLDVTIVSGAPCLNFWSLESHTKWGPLDGDKLAYNSNNYGFWYF